LNGRIAFDHGGITGEVGSARFAIGEGGGTAKNKTALPLHELPSCFILEHTSGMCFFRWFDIGASLLL